MQERRSGFESLDFHNPDFQRAQIDVTLGILAAIPPMSSYGGAEVRELEAVDKPRKDRLDYLVKIIEDQAGIGTNPTDAIYEALPHVQLVWGIEKGVEYYLRFAEIQHGFGNDPSPMFHEAEKIAREMTRGIERCDVAKGFAAEIFTKIGVTQSNLELPSSGMFDLAYNAIAKFVDETKPRGGFEAASPMLHAERVITIILEAGKTDEARVMLDRFTQIDPELSDWCRDLLDEDLEKAGIQIP